MSLSEAWYKGIVINVCCLAVKAYSRFPVLVMFITGNFQPRVQVMASLEIFPYRKKEFDKTKYVES